MESHEFLKIQTQSHIASKPVSTISSSDFFDENEDLSSYSTEFDGEILNDTCNLNAIDELIRRRYVVRAKQLSRQEQENPGSSSCPDAESDCDESDIARTTIFWPLSPRLKRRNRIFKGRTNAVSHKPTAVALSVLPFPIAASSSEVRLVRSKESNDIPVAVPVATFRGEGPYTANNSSDGQQAISHLRNTRLNPAAPVFVPATRTPSQQPATTAHEILLLPSTSATYGSSDFGALLTDLNSPVKHDSQGFDTNNSSLDEVSISTHDGSSWSVDSSMMVPPTNFVSYLSPLLSPGAAGLSLDMAPSTLLVSSDRSGAADLSLLSTRSSASNYSDPSPVPFESSNSLRQAISELIELIFQESPFTASFDDLRLSAGPTSTPQGADHGCTHPRPSVVDCDEARITQSSVHTTASVQTGLPPQSTELNICIGIKTGVLAVALPLMRSSCYQLSKPINTSVVTVASYIYAI